MNRENTMGRLIRECEHWQAKYKCLLAKVEPVHIEAAELLIKKAGELIRSGGSPYDLRDTVSLILSTATKLNHAEWEEKQMDKICSCCHGEKPPT